MFFSGTGILALKFNIGSYNVAGSLVKDWQIPVLIGLVLAMGPIYRGILNRPVIVIASQFIETKRFGKVYWREVSSIEIENVINDLDENPFLLIRGNNKRYRVSLEDLTKSQEEIEQLVASAWASARIAN